MNPIAIVEVTAAVSRALRGWGPGTPEEARRSRVRSRNSRESPETLQAVDGAEPADVNR